MLKFSNSWLKSDGVYSSSIFRFHPDSLPVPNPLLKKPSFSADNRIMKPIVFFFLWTRILGAQNDSVYFLIQD
jgi:hypothetical protein